MIPAKTVRHVWQRAQYRCEYCRIPQTSSVRMLFQIEHIRARKHGGKSTLDNLALACNFCNLHKGSDLAGIDPTTGRLQRLFNPRIDRWVEHFVVRRWRVTGRSAKGRTTVRVLQMNGPNRVQLRKELR